MDIRELSKRFLEMRKHQISTHGRLFNDTDLKVSGIIFEAATKAIDNVQKGLRHPCIQAVPLGTGLGKSSSAYALIATFAKQDPHFTAAYVVPTIKLAIEAQDGIEELLGKGSTTLLSSLHRRKGRDAERARSELGFVPTRLVDRLDLMNARIAILTHKELEQQLRAGTIQGALHYNCKPRSVVFIDEHPELVTQVNSTQSEVLSFHDQLLRFDPNHPWLTVLTSIVYAMSKITDKDGQRYEVVEIVPPQAKHIFDWTAQPLLWNLTDPNTSDDLRNIAVTKLKHIVEFLSAAAKGQAFYSRMHKEFTAYELHIGSDYPGFVLLDATSALAGVVTLNPCVSLLPVPTVNYEQLSVYSLEMPSKFRSIPEVTRVAAIGREYGRYIREAVLANTSVGDDVLIIVHKNVITQELLGITSEDPEYPMDGWEGRRVNTLNWGAGVGSNKFRAKTHIFLFGEYHLPRNATIAQTHGWSQRKISTDQLKNAEGHRCYNDTYAPGAIYRQVHDGHVLRWVKQLAMRGCARSVDGNGRCLPMKLFLTMERRMLIPNMQELFPGAPRALPAAEPAYLTSGQVKGRQALSNLAMESRLSYISARDIEERTGIPTRNLKREFIALEDIMKPLGWSLKSADELGFSGRMKYIAQSERLYQDLLAA